MLTWILQSRKLAQRRGSRYLAPEDLIFLIHYDRAKVNRLRNYLSWKDVRKNAKESGGDAGAGAGGDGDAMDEAGDDSPLRINKRKLRLPWELSSMLSDYPRITGTGAEEDAEEDEDTIETNEDSLRRLKAADETTRRMTREEYVFYSECRQASFTFRKGMSVTSMLIQPNASANLFTLGCILTSSRATTLLISWVSWPSRLYMSSARAR